MSDLPSYPRDAAERELAMPDEPAFTYASWGSRLGAYLLDVLILFVPLIVAIVLIAAADPDDESGLWIVAAILYLAALVLPFVYFTVMTGSERGQTYGKRALGIRVVDQQGERIGYGRAFGRYAITAVFGFFVIPVILDYLWPLWDGQNQALHDKVASSFVVRA